MARITVVFGILLILLGVVGYFASGQQSWTALIPAIFGAVLAILGGIAAAKPSLNKHVMHVAVLIGLLGLGGSIGGVVKLFKSFGGEPLARPAAVYAQTVMAILMIIYIALCVRSFISARRARKLETAA
jgi:lysylphosphatidylglycerol synthetase-like protein (DUF2156 family)